jgi:hypothetical protein
VGRWGRGDRRGGAGGVAIGDVKLGGAGARAARRAATGDSGGGTGTGNKRREWKEGESGAPV